MPIAGNPFTETLLLISSFFPLIPAGLIFLKKKFDKAPLNLLLIICLLNFIEGLSHSLSTRSNGIILAQYIENQYITKNIFSLLELVLLLQLFKPLFEHRFKYLLNILLVMCLSVIATYFSVKGWNQENLELDTFRSVLLTGVILAGLPRLVRTANIYIFRSPFFWIAIGSLFNTLLCLLLQWVNPCCQPANQTFPPEYTIFLVIAALVRYSLYTLAILTPGPDEGSEDQ